MRTLFVLALLAQFAFGQELHRDWVQREKTQYGSAGAEAVATDSAGNVFVIGYRAAGETFPDTLVSKYAAADGHLLWSRAFPVRNESAYLRRFIAVDGAGNAILAVSSDSPDRLYVEDIRAIKLRGSDGATVWDRRYDGPAHGDDEAAGLALDSSGNVLVVGSSNNASGPGSLVALKLAAGDGALLWTKRVLNVYAYAIAVDPSGNPVIAGYTSPGDFYTVKLARTSGVILWERRYDGSQHGEDGASALAIDSAGNPIVTGYSFAGSFECYTVKYAAADGATLWENHTPNVSEGRSIAITAAGDAIVAGGSLASKLAGKTGAVLWRQTVDFRAEAVRIDAQGNATVAGDVYDREGPFAYGDIRAARLVGSNGAFLWRVIYNGPNASAETIGDVNPLALTPDGGAAIVGSSFGQFLTVKYAPLPATPLTSVYVSSGAQLPGLDAKLSSFGVPAINDEGSLAYVARTGQESVLVARERIVARTGRPMPELYGAPGASFVSFSDPVLNDFGHVTFVGQIAGPGVEASNNQGVFTDKYEFLYAVARSGDTPLGGDGPRIESFRSISSSFGTFVEDTIFVAKFVHGVGGVTSANDLGVFQDNSGLQLILRTGTFVGTPDETPIVRLEGLESVPGSPGHGRSHVRGIFVPALTLASGKQALAVANNVRLFTGQPVNVAIPGGRITGARYQRFNIPSLTDEFYSTIPVSLTFLGSLEPGPGGVTATRARGIFISPLDQDEEVRSAVAFARTADPVPGLAGVTYADFLDPVSALVPAREVAVAAVATLAGTGVSTADDTALLVGGSATPGAEVLAREGGATAGISGANWQNFNSLAHPAWTNAGPLFTAQVQGGVSAANHTGLWSADYAGKLSLLLRTGAKLTVGAVSRTVREFTVLSDVPFSASVRRSFNAEHHVVVRVIFTDNTQALLRLTAP